MGFKFWRTARIKKGNKKNFKSNALTIAIAGKYAKQDMKIEKKFKKEKV